MKWQLAHRDNHDNVDIDWFIADNLRIVNGMCWLCDLLTKACVDLILLYDVNQPTVIQLNAMILISQWDWLIDYNSYKG